MTRVIKLWCFVLGFLILGTVAIRFQSNVMDRFVILVLIVIISFLSDRVQRLEKKLEAVSRSEKKT